MRTEIVNARVTFRNSPIYVLERFTFKDTGEAYRQFRNRSGLQECVILQTCNRVELFAAAGGEDCQNHAGVEKGGGGGAAAEAAGGAGAGYDMQRIKSTWASLAGVDEDAFDGNLEYARNSDAFRHLLRLTSGLDSMVVGEEQILGQVRGSISDARASGSSGENLNMLFDKAIRIGTRIRNATEISRGGVSVGSMAVRLAEENVDDLRSKTVLLIGTGDVATLVAKSLARRGYHFCVASRTMGRARAFCSALGGEPVGFEETVAGFGRYDVIFVATTAPYFLVTYEKIAGVVGGNGAGGGGNGGNRAMMILDLSNPRTVDEKVATLSGIKLMNLDQIAEMVDKNKRGRMGKIKTVENIIDGEMGVLEASMNRLDAEPVVKEVFKSVDMLREAELQKALKMLGENDESRIRIIDDLTKAVVESIIATPMNNLRKASEDGSSDMVDMVGRLFDYSGAGRRA